MYNERRTGVYCMSAPFLFPYRKMQGEDNREKAVLYIVAMCKE